MAYFGMLALETLILNLKFTNTNLLPIIVKIMYLNASLLMLNPNAYFRFLSTMVDFGLYNFGSGVTLIL